ncbi:sodium:solute symporter family protein [Pseudonocardia sp. KRD-184]|uniref:Sodium:solute symporter family protein n=1 Tax=Pseudonocardia oceani TaxID=2792013 RepID=A0ABS6UDN0_9PSEU|nr:sodium:solute symporter family protein [Pseudonocardia oceani]MBW0088875.1 sodium:solute symporter family protein [Pseudonocardia oceani]MBW0095794.1 sodium:solute symporter family protein [Pseudonocardia oceani]MBW0108956.1 sodium:solute symporter family protein [Pseudonocardia oceani]MBW0122182.1 sodium:solute symporter family protein [Pseudonocardia oceani]MBW0130358.1 sodium:solute symporter family protein [Pseudonocardia oceani]
MISAQADLRLDTTFVDYVFVAFYFLLALGIGVAARRSVNSSLDFLLSGRSLPAWVTGLAFIAANLGAIELIGFTANGAQYGMATVHYYWIGAVPAMVFLGIVMMPFYYGSKARSVPEFLRMRFNTTTQRVNAVTFALAQVLIAGVNLFALGLVLEALLGWSLAVAIPVAALVVLSYTFLGGLSAAIYNEVLQFFVILALLIPLTVAGLARVGGWNGLVERVTAGPGGSEQLSAWPGTELTEIENPVLSVIGIVFGLGFVLSFGYWTTNFAEVQRCLSAKSMSAARRTPIIAAFPKALIPAVIVVPGIIAAVLVPQITELKAGSGAEGVTYNNTLSLLMGEVLPNGVLGVALAGLLAAFMAGMAANVSSLNTVFTYDIWQDWLRPGRDDRYYLQVGRAVTVIGCILAIGTAFLAGSYENLMDYIQALFSFFNAPLFAIFILGLFWKRMSGTAGWTGLVSGTIAAVAVDVLVRTGVLALSSQAGSFVGASAAFVVGIAVGVAVTMVTSPKPDAELVGLVWQLTPKADRSHTTTGEDAGWYRSPALLGGIVLVLTAALYLLVP